MKYVTRKCRICGKEFQVKAFRIAHGRGKICSIPCRIEWQKKFVTGEKCFFWRGGGYINAGGYRYLKSPKHPFKNKVGYVAEHRLIMEKYLDRYLERSEFVHHKNGDKLDNRLENLQIISNQKEHSDQHRRKSKCCDKKHYGHGMCRFHYHQKYYINIIKPKKLADISNI